MATTTLALSIHDEYKKNKVLLSKPITTLSRMAGLKANDVYHILLPELVNSDLGEAIRFAEVGIKYAAIIDRNRLREEIGEAFIVALELIIDRVQDGLEDDKKWIKRKAIALHGQLIDEFSEKKRFIETVLVADKIGEVAKSLESVKQLEEEMLDFEKQEGDVYTLQGEQHG